MRSLSLVTIMKYSTIALLVLSVFTPLYSFPSFAGTSGDSVYVWNIVQHDLLVGIAFLIPFLTLTVLSIRFPHPWNRVVLTLAPLVILVSVFVVYLESALAMSSLQMPFPVFPLPSLWTSSSIGIGCWAFVSANVFLLGIWFNVARKKMHGERAGAI